MKSVILAGTLAVLANGSKVSNFDKKLSSVSKRVPREKARAEVKSNSMKTKELQAKMMKEAPMTEEAISKDGFLTEGVSTGWKVFEMTAGATGCDDYGRDVTFGINMWRCTDAIWQTTDPGGENIGYAESYVYYYAGNGGFPKVAYFDGHGCDWNNLYWIDRVYKTDFGFPMNYKPWDGCVAASDEAGMPVYMDATWRNEAHKPMYDSVIFTDSKSHKACNKERDTWYEITKSNACRFDHHDMSGPVWEKMTVNACNETAGNFNVVSASYSDSACTNMIDSDTHTSPEWCMFDLDEFDYGLMDMNYGSMLYTSKYCHKEPITPP